MEGLDFDKALQVALQINRTLDGNKISVVELTLALSSVLSAFLMGHIPEKDLQTAEDACTNFRVFTLEHLQGELGWQQGGRRVN